MLNDSSWWMGGVCVLLSEGQSNTAYLFQPTTYQCKLVHNFCHLLSVLCTKNCWRERESENNIISFVERRNISSSHPKEKEKKKE